MATLLDIVKKGSTDRSVCVRVIDNTTGLPATRAYNDTGVDLWYRREGAAVTSITEATLANLTTAHADGGFLVVSNGEHRLDLPDAAVAAGANYVDVGGTFTGYTVIGGRIRLVDYDPEDTVRLGLTAMPAVASGSAGAIVTSGTGTAQLSVTSGRAASDVTHVAGTAWASTNIGRSTSTIVPGTVTNAGLTPTTTQFECSDITEATADHFVGRLVIFTAGALLYQAARITAYSLNTGRGRFTVTTMTEAPANADTLILV